MPVPPPPNDGKRNCARKPPRNNRPWTPEKVRERIRISMIARRLELCALNKLKADAKNAADRPMDAIQLRAAAELLDRCLPRAQYVDVNVGGSITVVKRDPTHRDEGYKRRRHDESGD
jgi:hypothetical protein